MAPRQIVYVLRSAGYSWTATVAELDVELTGLSLAHARKAICKAIALQLDVPGAADLLRRSGGYHALPDHLTQSGIELVEDVLLEPPDFASARATAVDALRRVRKAEEQALALAREAFYMAPVNIGWKALAYLLEVPLPLAKKWALSRPTRAIATGREALEQRCLDLEQRCRELEAKLASFESRAR